MDFVCGGFDCFGLLGLGLFFRIKKSLNYEKVKQVLTKVNYN